MESNNPGVERSFKNGFACRGRKFRDPGRPGFPRSVCCASLLFGPVDASGKMEFESLLSDCMRALGLRGDGSRGTMESSCSTQSRRATWRKQTTQGLFPFSCFFFLSRIIFIGKRHTSAGGEGEGVETFYGEQPHSSQA